MDNFIITILFALYFAAFDYIFYNMAAVQGWVNEKLINPYRILQTSVQVISIGIAYFFFNWIVALGFIILWWSWVCDWIFYLYTWVCNFFEDRKYLSLDYFNKITWSWWTWYGLIIHKGNREYKFKFCELVIQSVIGILIVLLLCLKTF